MKVRDVIRALAFAQMNDDVIVRVYSGPDDNDPVLQLGVVTASPHIAGGRVDLYCLPRLDELGCTYENET